jgi:hypothetical protein
VCIKLGKYIIIHGIDNKTGRLITHIDERTCNE